MSNVVTIVDETPAITVVLAPTPALTVQVGVSQSIQVTTLERGPKGDQGAQGTQGPTGPPASTAAFTYYQNIPSAQWTVVHNLGRRPSVTVIDSANDDWLPDAFYQDVNTVILTFGAAFSGVAYLI